MTLQTAVRQQVKDRRKEFDEVQERWKRTKGGKTTRKLPGVTQPLAERGGGYGESLTGTQKL